MTKSLAEVMAEMGTPFHKMESDTMVFQLANEEVEEQFKIWDNQENVWYQGEDELKATTGEVVKVNDTKFIKQKVFEEFFPHKRKNTQYVRTIIIDVQEKKFGFKKTAEDALKQLISTLKATNQDPTQYKFKMSKTGTGVQTRYTVIVDGQGNGEVKQAPTINIQSMELSKEEKALVEAYKNGVNKEDWNETDFIKVADSNNLNIAEDRLKEIFSKEMK